MWLVVEQVKDFNRQSHPSCKVIDFNSSILVATEIAQPLSTGVDHFKVKRIRLNQPLA